MRKRGLKKRKFFFRFSWIFFFFLVPLTLGDLDWEVGGREDGEDRGGDVVAAVVGREG